MELISPREVINQGAIIQGALRFKGDDLTKVSRFKLSDMMISGTLYISSSGSVMRTDGADYLDIPVTFTFTKVPETNILEQNIKDELLKIDISGIRIQPSVAGDQLIIEDFIIPINKEWGLIIVFGVLLLALTAVGVKVFFSFRQKREKRRKIQLAKEKILQATSYDEITQVWQDRVHLLELFPLSEKAFRNFEMIYFKYAFKPSQTEEEIGKIRGAYEEYSSKLEGGESGV